MAECCGVVGAGVLVGLGISFGQGSEIGRMGGVGVADWSVLVAGGGARRVSCRVRDRARAGQAAASTLVVR